MLLFIKKANKHDGWSTIVRRERDPEKLDSGGQCYPGSNFRSNTRAQIEKPTGD